MVLAAAWSALRLAAAVLRARTPALCLRTPLLYWRRAASEEVEDGEDHVGKWLCWRWWPVLVVGGGRWSVVSKL